MTAIVGLVNDGIVWMGADSFIGSDEEVDLMEESKIYRVGPMIMADAGKLSPGQLIHYKWTAPPYPTKGTGDRAMIYLCRDVMPSLKSFFTEEGVEDEKDDEGNPEGISILIGMEDRLFEINSWGVTESRHKFAAIGSASDVARGSLYSTRNWKNPENRILEALRASAALIPTVRRPWTVVTT